MAAIINDEERHNYNTITTGMADGLIIASQAPTERERLRTIAQTVHASNKMPFKDDQGPTRSMSHLFQLHALCTRCRHIEFYPMKAMAPERWLRYFPFLKERQGLLPQYIENYHSFVRQVPDDFEFEAMWHADFDELQESALSGSCTFCYSVWKMLHSSHVGRPTEPARGTYGGIAVIPPPMEWPEENLDDLRRATPRIWLEISLPPFDAAQTTLKEALTDAFIQIKLANCLVYPRYLISEVQVDGHSRSPWSLSRTAKSHTGNSDTSTGSLENLKLARSWLQTCRTTHKQCMFQNETARELPTRLLDLQAPGLEKDVVLCLSSTINSPIEDAGKIGYASLSHCWGSSPLLKTEWGNYGKHLKSINFSELPKTFQQAIAFSRTMDIRYLWIDSLCIIQDSEADKDSELPKMGKIYRNAIFNIAACSAADSSQGLFSDRNAALVKPQDLSFNITTADGQEFPVKTKLSPALRAFAHQKDKISNTLDSRGWVFQERALSKRIFSFEQQMMWFECGEMIASENVPNGAPLGYGNEKAEVRWENLLPAARKRDLSHFGQILYALTRELDAPTRQEYINDLYYTWYNSIPSYMSRSFTYESDRLPAISGLAALIQGITHDTYLAGIWRSKLITGLCWSYDGRKSKRITRAPSWSWASLEGPAGMFYSSRRDFMPEHQVEVLDAWVTPESPNVFGNVVAGEVRLKGRIRKAVAWSVMSGGGYEAYEGLSSVFDEEYLKANKSVSYLCGGLIQAKMDNVEEYKDQQEVWVLPLVGYWPVVKGVKRGKKLGCLVLKKDGEVFRREGYIWRLSRGSNEEWDEQDEDGEGSWFQSKCEEAEVVIV